MREIFFILKFKLLFIFKTALDSKWGAVLKELASVAVFTGFALSTFISSNYATAYLLSEAKIGLFLFHRILSMLLFILFVLVSLGNMIVAYSTLYKSKDIEFFLTTPIKPIKIYVLLICHTYTVDPGHTQDNSLPFQVLSVRRCHR